MTRPLLPFAFALTLAGIGLPKSSSAQTPAGARFAPATDGYFGTWLVAGPFRPGGAAPVDKAAPKKTEGPLLDFAPAGVDDAKISARSGAALAEGRTWLPAASEGSGLDLRAPLGITAKDKDLVAYASAVIDVPRAGRYSLLFGASDGLRVFVDGKRVLSREEPRGVRDNDDIVSLDLRAGPHTVVVKLRRYDGPMTLRARLLDDTWRAPAKAAIVLPGATADDADKMARRLSWVTVDRGLTERGYEPKVVVRFPEGLPLGPAVRASARLRAVVGGRDADVLATTPSLVVPTEGSLVGEIELPFAPIEGDGLAAIEDKTLTVEVDVGGRIVRAPMMPRKATRAAVRRALFALAAVPSVRPAWLQPGSHESVDHLRRRLQHLVARGDADAEALARETRELDAAAAALETERDPFDGRTGFLRRAYRSPVDGELAPYGLYVPDSYKRGDRRSFPLIVALHGLNGKPMAMLRWFFGGDDPKRDQEWEERHFDGLGPLDAFVLAPSAHGNSMYRYLGQDDVMRALDEVMAAYPIDASRVTVTGPSMGGIGAASVALRRPDRFAAAAPLCGYHSLFVRRDVMGRSLRPWERFLGEERSNVAWAANGRELPLFIVHGTLDTPTENSGVLIERYEALKYPIVHEHPALGHNVWQPTYENLKGARWLLGHTRDRHPKQIRYRTARSRDGRIAWAEVTELAGDAWGELDAKARSRSALTVTTRGIAGLRFDRDDKVVDPSAPLEVAIDGQTLTFAPSEPVQLFRDGETWKAGARSDGGRLRKRGALAGPFRDVFHEPLLFVYGASDESEARVNEEVARAFARVRWGVDVRYPIMSDREFFARGESLANERTLFLVGGAHSNAVVKALESELPIQVNKGVVTVGSRRFETGRELGAAFVYPNPKRADRYVAVVAGATALGTLRSLSLPDLVPDFVVYDERLTQSRDQIVLGAGALLAGGFFTSEWALPTRVDDPLRK